VVSHLLSLVDNLLKYLSSLKVNFKLGGRNHQLQDKIPLSTNLNTDRTMIVGADVTHPTKCSDPGCPSLAGVVSCMGNDSNDYLASARIQSNNTEVSFCYFEFS